MRTAIDGGLFSTTESHSDTTGFCPSTNCTWDPYSSLGFCATVEDVTSSIIKDCPNDQTAKGPVQGCTYTTPDLNNFNSSMAMNYSSGQNLYVGSIFRKATESLPTHNTSLAEAYIIYDQNVSALLDYDDSSNTVAAYKATMSLCLYTFNTTIIDGLTNTTVLVTMNNESDWAFSDNKTDSSYKLTATANNDPKEYWTYGTSIGTLRSYLTSNTLTGSASVAYLSGGDNYWSSDSAKAFAAAVWGENGNETLGIAGVEARFQNLTISMTNAFVTLSLPLLTLQSS